MEALKKLEAFKGRKGPVLLCIMDGVAYGKVPEADAFAQAHTPTIDKLLATCPNTKLKAHGSAVGMPTEGDMGNSEVGHNAIGCGRVFSQGAKLVDEAVKTGALYDGQIWQEQIQNVLDNDSTLHFIGLFSDGNVHSHIDHTKSMIAKANELGVKKIRCHILIDGRDVGETSAFEYLDPFEAMLAEYNANGVDYRIASGGGRMNITMDRYDADWPMVERGWNFHVKGVGRQFATAKEAIQTYRDEVGCIDQDLPGFVIAENGKAVGPIVDNDSVILTNFRGDRGIELTKSFEMGDDFKYFDRGTVPKVKYAAIMEYDADLKIPRRFLVSPPSISRTMGEYLANENVRQFAISETQKFGHVTYFFNGNRSEKFDDNLETYVEITSDLVPFE